MYADAFNVLQALEAGTAQELSRLMLINNMKHSKMFQYQVVVKNNKFYAWYYNSLTQKEIMDLDINKVKGKK